MEDWAKGYIAGIIDGEGNLYIAKAHESTFSAKVRVRMTDKNTVNHLKLLTGLGNVNMSLPKQKCKDGSDKRPIWEWCVARREEILSLLTEIKPYLKTKSKHAEILLELESLKTQGIKNGNEVLTLRNELSELAIK